MSNAAPPTPPTETPAMPPTNETPLAFRAVRGGLWVLGSSYWTIGFGWLANILLTRLLTPEIYGQFSLALFFFTLLQLRSKLGLNFAYAHHRQTTGAAVGTLFGLDVALGIGGFALTVAAMPVLLWIGYQPAVVTIMVVLAALALLESVTGVFGATLDKDLHFKPGSIISSIALPVSYIPAFALALNGQGELSLIAQAATFSLVGLAGGIYYVWTHMRHLLRLHWRFDAQLAHHFVRFGAATGIGGFLGGMVSQADNFVVGTVAGTGPLGYYDRGYRTAQWSGLLLNGLITRSALFTYANLQGDRARLEKSASMIFWVCVTVATPVTLALFVAAPDLILLVYGERWLPAVPLLRILLVAAVLRPLLDNAGALFVGTGKPTQLIILSTIQLALILALGWPLASFFGASGVAVAVVIAMTLALAVIFYQIRDTVTINVLALLGLPGLAALLTVALYALLVRAIPLHTWPLAMSVLLKMAYAAAAFALFSFLLQPRATVARIAYIVRLVRNRQGNV